MAGKMCGGCSSQPVTEKVQEICNKVKSDAERQANGTYDVFEAVEYKSQCVAGTNHFVKVHVGEGVHVHLRVYEKLPCAGGGLELSAIQVDKTREHPLEYF